MEDASSWQVLFILLVDRHDPITRSRKRASGKFWLDAADILPVSLVEGVEPFLKEVFSGCEEIKASRKGSVGAQICLLT
jgi:hypothetical protein